MKTWRRVLFVSIFISPFLATIGLDFMSSIYSRPSPLLCSVLESLGRYMVVSPATHIAMGSWAPLNPFSYMLSARLYLCAMCVLVIFICSNSKYYMRVSVCCSSLSTFALFSSIYLYPYGDCVSALSFARYVRGCVCVIEVVAIALHSFLISIHRCLLRYILTACFTVP